MKLKVLFSCLAVVLMACAGSASAQTQPAGAQAPATPAPAAPPAVGTVQEPASSAYILGRDDVVEVGLLGRNDFGGRARVQADGTIQLPFVGKIPATERTTAELSEAIRKALQTGGYFSDPVVTIEVVGYASRYVTVLGQVGVPGLIPINRPYRLSELLARVGGVREGAADYLVVRSVTGPERKLLIKDLAMGDLSQDPYVQAGDKIYAPVADVFYISGQIKAPGAYPIQQGLTVRMAIARGGGLTESGSDKKVETNRDGKKVKLKPEDAVQVGDVLVVGERLF